MARAVYKHRPHTVSSLRASTLGGTTEVQAPGSVADVQLMTEEVMNQVCRQASARFQTG